MTVRYGFCSQQLIMNIAIPFPRLLILLAHRINETFLQAYEKNKASFAGLR